MPAKEQMTEEEIKLNFITPAIEDAGWKKAQIRMEFYFTEGRIIIDGKTSSRAKGKKADYLLYYRSNLPIAIVEAKDNSYTVKGGIQQAIGYAEILKIPFAYSSNGDGFVEHDMVTGAEREIKIDEFPSPDVMWEKFKTETDMTPEQETLALVPYHYSVGGKVPRYYQQIAINKATAAIAKGQKRLLLVLATGAGKTLIAFQIIYRLLTAKKIQKVLFLADRNILVDDPMRKDFQPLEKVMTKIEGHNIDTSFQVFLSLYQQLQTQTEAIFKKLDPDFFDLIIIDECHRSSANDDSNWHEILEYFSSAIQIGMTATPKEEVDVSNINYFGESVYTYSLKNGIQDGFLAPYQVVKVNLDIDIDGFRPFPGMLDIYGNELENKLYEQKDFDRVLVVEERTLLVAKRITEYLKSTNNRFAKTIVFCVDIPHAERMREALINENKDLVAQNSRYIMQITGDNEDGKNQLDNFMDPYEKYPVIAVTSRLLSTGVDIQTCKVIALDRLIGSMTEFKQIIGRGTRIKEEYVVDGKKQSKYFFTILDFRKNYVKFSDPEFDGEPVCIIDLNGKDTGGGTEPGGDAPPTEDGDKSPPPPPPPSGRRKKYTIRGIDVNIINERVEYLDANGNLITVSIFEYSRRNLQNVYPLFDEFREAWLAQKKKDELLSKLEDDGVFIEAVKETLDDEIDEYDILSYIGYDKTPIRKEERIDRILISGYIDKYSSENQTIIKMLLEEYRTKSIDELRNLRVLSLPKFVQIKAPAKIVQSFGGKEHYGQMLDEIEGKLYEQVN